MRPLSDSAIALIRKLAGNKAAGISDEILRLKAMQLPIRLVVLSGFVIWLFRATPQGKVDQKRLFLFNAILSLLGVYYSLDLYGYLRGLYGFSHAYQLPTYARLFMGQEITFPDVEVLGFLSVASFLACLLWPQKGVYKAFAFLAFALLESLVYGYGYTENTFTSFRLAQWFLFLYSLRPGSAAVYFGQVAILLCYIIPGVEKLLSFGFGLLDLAALKDYGRYFKVDETLFVWVYGIALFLQVSLLAAFNNPRLRKASLLVLVPFHAGTAILGVGGITTPWIPALLFLLV